jgi:lipopolysaccharide transport system permease protein
VIETFKYGFFGKGYFSWEMLAYSAVFALVSFIIGLAVFNRTEKNFMDTV